MSKRVREVRASEREPATTCLWKNEKEKRAARARRERRNWPLAAWLPTRALISNKRDWLWWA
jgi:hypothetical protein